MDQYTFHIPPDCDEEVLIVYSDDHVLVVNKPAGLLSVPGRVVKDCVVNRVAYDFPDAAIVHRLDLDTSGLLVLALSKLARSELNRQFRERLIGKEYIADVFGTPVSQKGRIDLPIAPDPDNRPKQLIDHEKGKASVTFYEVLSEQADRARLLLKPITGRSHQLRIHLAEIGHPILGCDLYAHPAAFKASSRLHLHASFLQFSHPLSKELLAFRDPAPFT